MTGDRPELGLLDLGGVADTVEVADPRDTELGLMRDLGKNLVNYLFMSLRTLAIHDSGNAAVDEPLRRLWEVLDELARVIHRTHFITVEGQVYLNDLRIKTEPSAYNNLAYLVGQLDRHGIGGITFHKAPPQAQIKELLLLLLNTRPPGEGDALDAIRLVLAESDVHDVELDRPYYFKSGDGQAAVVSEGAAEQQEVAALSYAKGVLAVKDYFRAVEAAETANPLRIRKIMHDLVDLAEESPQDFLKLHTIHGVEDPYYNHCTNVAALAVAVGRELGLGRVDLSELGSAAMFHDLGYAVVERWSEGEGRETTEDERMREHPIAGFRTLLKQGEFGPGLLRRMLVTLEHHMHFRRPGGYPHLGRKRLSVFTRIVQVADYYDALVTPMGEERPMLPVRALERLVGNKGAVFDPLCVKALVNVVGRYPYGSLVRLSSGELGVVTSGGRSAEAFSKPLVMIVRNADGSETPPREIDLSTDRVLRRRVVEVMDPFIEDITPHAVLFGELGDKDDVQPEAEGGGVDAEEWTRALWEGEDTDAIVTGRMGAILEEDLPAAADLDAPEPSVGGAPDGPDLPPVGLAASGSLDGPDFPVGGAPDGPDLPPVGLAASGSLDGSDFPVGGAPDGPDLPPVGLAGSGSLDPWEPPEEALDPMPWEDPEPDLAEASEAAGDTLPLHPPAGDPWGFGAVVDHRDDQPDAEEDEAFAREAPGTAGAEIAPLTEAWEPAETAATLAPGSEAPRGAVSGAGASLSRSEAPPRGAASGAGVDGSISRPLDRPSSSLSPGATQESAAASAPDAAPATNLSVDEIAERKAAWAKAMREAYQRGGEAAVRSLASKTWYNFDRDD